MTGWANEMRQGVILAAPRKLTGVYMSEKFRADLNLTTESGLEQLDKRQSGSLPIKKLILVAVPLVVLVITRVYFAVANPSDRSQSLSAKPLDTVKSSTSSQSVNSTRPDVSSQNQVVEPHAKDSMVQSAVSLIKKRPAVTALVAMVILLVIVAAITTAVLMTNDGEEEAEVVSMSDPNHLPLKDIKTEQTTESGSGSDGQTEEKSDTDLIIGLSVGGFVSLVLIVAVVLVVKKRLGGKEEINVDPIPVRGLGSGIPGGSRGATPPLELSSSGRDVRIKECMEILLDPNLDNYRQTFYQDVIFRSLLSQTTNTGKIDVLLQALHPLNESIKDKIEIYFDEDIEHIKALADAFGYNIEMSGNQDELKDQLLAIIKMYNNDIDNLRPKIPDNDKVCSVLNFTWSCVENMPESQLILTAKKHEDLERLVRTMNNQYLVDLYGHLNEHKEKSQQQRRETMQPNKG